MATEMIDQTLVRRAREVWRDRRHRDKVFGNYIDGFGEPAWDMLLALFVAAGAGSPWTPIVDLLAAVPVPPDVARPYVTWLATQHLAKLHKDAAALAPKGQELLMTYLNPRQ